MRRRPRHKNPRPTQLCGRTRENRRQRDIIPPAMTPPKKSGATRHVEGHASSVGRGDGLLPLPLMTEDPTRKMLDDAVSEALGMGDLHPLHAALAQEPIIVSRLVEGDK